MHRSIVLALGLVLAACGGGGGGDFPPESGVDPSTPLMNLTPGEQTTLCEWAIDAQGGAGHVENCGDDLMITTQTVAECMASFAGVTCTATVGEIEDCINAIGGNGCELFTESACDVFFECAN